MCLELVAFLPEGCMAWKAVLQFTLFNPVRV